MSTKRKKCSHLKFRKIYILRFLRNIVDKKSSNYEFEFKEFDRAWKEFFKNKPRPKNDEEDKKQQEEFCHWYNNIRKQSDTGKTPVEMNSRIIEFRWDEEYDEEPFVYLKNLLVPETEKIKKLKKLQEKDVMEYSGVLLSIELNIARFFIENRTITDLHTILALKNFIQDPFKELDYIKNPLEYEIQFGSSVGAQRKKISLHELKLCINYIITSIKNRNYLQDRQAYLKWISAFLGLLDKKEVKEIEDYYRLFGLVNNVPKQEIDFMIKSLHPEKLMEEK